jgi:hypothetical protein
MLSDKEILAIRDASYAELAKDGVVLGYEADLAFAREVERAAREQVIDELRDIENDDPGRPLIDAIRALRED